MSKLDPFESSPIVEIDMKEKCIKVEVEMYERPEVPV